MPWRNGLGTTAEVVAEPGPGGRFRFRLSIADVASSGPFSDFAGYERHILLLEGAGCTLFVEGREPCVLDRPLVPCTFDGGSAARCELHDGPVKDLNLMVDRASALGALDVLWLRAGEEAELPAAATVLLHVAGGLAEAAGERLGPGETLRADLDDGEVLRVAAVEDAALVVGIVEPIEP